MTTLHRPDTSTSAEALDAAASRLARRPWPITPIKSTVDVSFEFFPPGSASAEQSLAGCIDQLAPFNPSFVSVTYGAGGTTQDRTHAAVESIGATTDLAVAGHLTCVGASRGEVLDVVDRYVEAGVSRIVALRGDPAPGETGEPRPDGFASATELVAGIRDRVGDSIGISVAAYPEVHPKATSARSDLDNLKAKIDAGADQALTQFFFDDDAYLRFLEQARAAGISAPIVPGIMPVTNFARLTNFAGRCGTVIPDWMHDLFGGLDEMPDVQQLVAATLAAEQCRRLAEHGVSTFHFYTMNKPELTAATCTILGVRRTDSDRSHHCTAAADAAAS